MTSNVTTPGESTYEGRHRLSVVHLLIALTALFVVMPLVDRLAYGAIIETFAFTLVLLAAVNAIGGRRRIQFTAAALAAPALAAHWLHHLWPDALPVEVRLIADILFVSYVIVHLFRFVLRAPEVNVEVMCAAVCIFLLLAVAWAFLYTILARWEPNAFSITDGPAGAKPTLAGFMALYFSVQVITTITFGDVMPVSNIARMTTIVEATTGVFYMAILISRLVGLYASAPPAKN